ncbi:MAG: hypothetical protein O9341_02480, partial [Paucibacter sp.]|nr:hypothetical protein [Roseateles sp.]
MNFLNDCDPDATAKPVVRWLWDFADTQSLGLDVYHQFAHGLDDLAYIERVKGIAELPCLLQSPEFLKRISDPAGYKEAANMINEQNLGRAVGQCQADGTQWQSLFYKSAYLGTPDSADAFGRFLVVVPGTTHDRWIQFGIWTPGEVPQGGASQRSVKINNVSVVAAAKNRVVGDGRFNVVLDWWRTYDGPSVSLSTRRQATGVTGNCQQCHKTAVIGIHPAEIYRPDQSGKLVPAPELQAGVDALNKLIRGKEYRFPTQAVFDSENADAVAESTRYGPELGPDEDDRPTRKEDLMKACTARHGLNQDSVIRVSKNMSCAQCHNSGPKGKGLINFPMATQMTKASKLTGETWPNLVYHYIMRGLMPPPDLRVTDPPLNEPEKEALFDCLALEYHDVSKNQGLFVDWLRNGPKAKRERDAETLAMLARAMTQTRPTVASRTQRVAMSRAGAADFADKC